MALPTPPARVNFDRSKACFDFVIFMAALLIPKIEKPSSFAKSLVHLQFGLGKFPNGIEGRKKRMLNLASEIEEFIPYEYKEE